MYRFEKMLSNTKYPVQIIWAGKLCKTEIDEVIKSDKEDLELYINKNDLKEKSRFINFLNDIKSIFKKAK